MKRGIILLILLALLISPTILAIEENPIVPTDTEFKEQLSTLRGGLNEETENILEKEIRMPKELEFIYFVITGVGKGVEAISWGKLIVFILTVSGIFIFSLEILEFTAFETNWVKGLIAGSIATILAITGAIYKLINLFYTLIDNFYYVVGGIIAVLILLLILKPIINGIKNRKKISKAEELGIKSGAVLKGLSKTSDAILKNK